MPTIDCSSYDEINNLIDNNPDVVIDFYATWCQPCMKGAPLFEEKSNDKKYKHITFIKINIDTIQDYLGDFEVTSIPTIIRYKNRKMCKKITGLNPDALNDILS